MGSEGRQWVNNNYLSLTPLGHMTEDLLLHMYSRDGRKRFLSKDIQRVEEGYSPGRVDLPLEKRDAINSCLEMLQLRGYIRLKKDSNDKASTLYGGAFTENMEIYCLNRGIRTKKQIIEQEQAAVRKCTDIKSAELSRWLAEEESSGRYVVKTFRSISEQDFREKDFINAVRIADEILSGEKHAVYERDIAKKAVNDSKGITSGVRRILERILFECADEEIREFFDERKAALGDRAQILPLYGVVKTPEYILTHGSMEISLKNGKIIDTQGYPYAFSSEYLSDIESICANGKKFVTIENRTSYEDFHEDGTVKIYTGGFLSFPERMLLVKIREGNPASHFLHWSDIDCGGIRIFRQIKKYIPSICPYQMDVRALEENRGLWTGLTDNDRRFLTGCLADPVFGPLASYMLKNNCKLEQESLYARK